MLFFRRSGRGPPLVPRCHPILQQTLTSSVFTGRSATLNSLFLQIVGIIDLRCCCILDVYVFWFAAVPFEQLLTLYTCTHTFKVSFSQRGTLAFAACLSNLTSKGLGHLSLSLSLSLSLISPCVHAHEITLFQRARVYHAPEGSRLRSETQLRSREAGAYVIFQQTRKKRSSSEDRCLRSKLLCKCFCWYQ